MVVFLTSSFVDYQAPENEYRPLPIVNDNGFVDNIKKYWKENTRLLVFSSDPDDYAMSDRVAKQMYDCFTLSGLTIEEVRVFDHRSTETLEELLRWSDALYVSGGHAPTENIFMKDSDLPELIGSYEGLVITLSAGSVNSAKSVYLMPELEGEASDPDFCRHTTGLGLTNINMVPHSQFMKTVELDGMDFMEEIIAPDSNNNRLYLVPDGSYFVIADGVISFYGDGEIMENGNIRPITDADIEQENKIERETFETVMKNGYNFVAEMDLNKNTFRVIHLGPLFLRHNIHKGNCHDYSGFCSLLAKTLLVHDEREVFLEQCELQFVTKEIKEMGSFVRTIHFDIDSGRYAEAFRIRKINHDPKRLLLTVLDISAVLDRDWMTDEYGRTGFIYAAARLIKKLDLSEGYSLVYTNIKGFKAINEIFGEQGGDMAIFSVRDQIRRILDPLVLGRFESDHFVFIARDSMLTEENFNRLCKQVHIYDNRSYVYNIRCGIYNIRSKEVGVSHMADRARIAEKLMLDTIDGNYKIYDDDIRVNYVRQRELVSDLENAVKNMEFIAYYQPIIDVRTNKICSAEALVRWNHHAFGMVSPGQFVPVFEKSGKITYIDSFMVDTVVDFLKERYAAKKNIVPCAINLSRMDFYDSGFLQRLNRLINNHVIPASLIKLEITESAYFELESKAMDFLQSMKNSGVRIMLDDYGSGMSSLSTLESFEFDTVKLDMGFIRKIGTQKVESIIRSTIELSHALGATVIAEGVENDMQLNFLRESDCDMIQGYYFFKPMTGVDFAKVLS